MPATETPTRTEIRGSQKLLAHVAKNGEVPSVEQIKKALALPAGIEYTIPNWLTRGTPQSYLEFEASLSVPLKSVGDVVNHFIALNDSAIGLKILINGIPWPELATIVVRNTPGEL